VGATAITPGTCQPGKKVGEPCRPEPQSEPGSGRGLSDCGYLLRCLDVDGSGPRCHAGNRLGQRCGHAPDLGKDIYLECVEGYCERPGFAQVGTCKAAQSSGPCWGSGGFIPPTECRAWNGNQLSCGTSPPLKEPGAACSTGNDRECGVLDYCRPTSRPPADVAGPFPGQCAHKKKFDEACVEGWDKCEPSHRCEFGVCVKCG
jgi:hypothetical protein